MGFVFVFHLHLHIFSLQLKNVFLICFINLKQGGKYEIQFLIAPIHIAYYPLSNPIYLKIIFFIRIKKEIYHLDLKNGFLSTYPFCFVLFFSTFFFILFWICKFQYIVKKKNEKKKWNVSKIFKINIKKYDFSWILCFLSSNAVIFFSQFHNNHWHENKLWCE